MAANKNAPTVFTVCEVAKILRIGKISAYQAIARGDIPCIRIGRSILIPRQDDFTDAYIAFSRRISTRDTRFHDLRHTHASELLRRGVPLRTVSQRLGHANPTVTLNIYAHVMSGDDTTAADTVEEMIKKLLEKKGAKKPE
jgi:excisionase family DNA binding protein